MYYAPGCMKPCINLRGFTGSGKLTVYWNFLTWSWLICKNLLRGYWVGHLQHMFHEDILRCDTYVSASLIIYIDNGGYPFVCIGMFLWLNLLPWVLHGLIILLVFVFCFLLSFCPVPLSVLWFWDCCCLYNLPSNCFCQVLSSCRNQTFWV